MQSSMPAVVELRAVIATAAEAEPAADVGAEAKTEVAAVHMAAVLMSSALAEAKTEVATARMAAAPMSSALALA